jgi:excisionase family DNA binding protein
MAIETSKARLLGSTADVRLLRRTDSDPRKGHAWTKDRHLDNGQVLNQRRRLTIRECCVWANIGRSHLYEIIGRGELRAKKDGRRTYILLEDLEAWITSLPDLQPPASKGEPAKES